MWLETDRTVVALLVVNVGFRYAKLIANMVDRNVQLVNPRTEVEVHRLYKASLIIKASCLFRLVSGLAPRLFNLFVSREWVVKRVRYQSISHAHNLS